MKNDLVFNGEKSLQTNEALMGELSLFKIGTIQGNGESIEMGQATDSDLNRYSIRLSLALPPNSRLGLRLIP
jgi:hypothetical protein